MQMEENISDSDKQYIKNISIFTIENDIPLYIRESIQKIRYQFKCIQRFVFIANIKALGTNLFFKDQFTEEELSDIDVNQFIFRKKENIEFLSDLIKQGCTKNIVIDNNLFNECNDQIQDILLEQSISIALIVFDMKTAEKVGKLFEKHKIIFVIKKKSVNDIKKNINLPNCISKAFNFHQVDAYVFDFNKSKQFMLHLFAFYMNLPFPDSSEIDDYDYTNLKRFLQPGLFDPKYRCQNCGAIRFNSSFQEQETCCNNIECIRDHMVTFEEPPQYLNDMLENFNKNTNMLRLINRCCRPRIQRTSINYKGNYSSLFLNGVPYAIDSRFQFLEPAFLIFNNFDKNLNNWHINPEDYANIFEVCKKFINNNPLVKKYILDSLGKIGGRDDYVALVKGIVDNGMNLAFINFDSMNLIENPLQVMTNVNSNKKNDNDDDVITELNANFNNDDDLHLSDDCDENNKDVNYDENNCNITEYNTDIDDDEKDEYQIVSVGADESIQNRFRDYQTKQIYAGDSEYDTLIYPLLFWNGKGGCGKLQNEPKFFSNIFRYSVIAMCMQSPSYYFNRCSALKEEFICSAYGRITQLRVNYQYNLQKHMFMKKEIKGGENALQFGIKTYVPASFTGSYQYWKHVSNQGFYLTLILGPPKFFVTITFNPKWNEVKALNHEEKLVNNSPLIARIFNQKKNCFIRYVKSHNLFGNVNGLLWRVEYQQRGLPHCHILIWSDFDTDDIYKIDKLITCKLPERDPYEENNEKWSILKKLSEKFMTHNCTQRCKKENGDCIYGYPKEPCEKTHYENGILIHRRNENDKFIVPHNPQLLALYRAHVEIEAINSERCIGYVLKYVSKNSDEVDVSVKENKYCGKELDKDDHLRKYASSRIVSAVEAFSSLAGYNKYGMTPSVSILSIHLPDEKIISVPFGEDPERWISKNEKSSKLERYFLRPEEEEFDNIKLCDYYGLYSVDLKGDEKYLQDNGIPKNWVHKKKTRSYCCIQIVDPSNQELFTLRLLLLNFPARSYDDLLIVDGIKYDSFYESAFHRGLVSDGSEYYICINEAIETNRPPADIRFMIALFAQQGVSLKNMLDQYKIYLSKDLGDVPLYAAMHTLLEQMHMFVPNFLGEEFIPDEIPLNERVDSTILNDLQKYAVKKIYEKIACNKENDPYLMFIQGRAGTGKTYTTNVLINILRKKGFKVLVTGTTGIAATQYEHGMTCHSLFKLKIDQNYIGNEFKCNVGYGTYRANELLNSDLIIIDEISMLTIQTAHHIDHTLRSLILYHKYGKFGIERKLDEIEPFGGKNILFVGDLLQLPPVIQGSDSSVANKLITNCSFWPLVQLFGLKEAVRCLNQKWNDFLIDIGNGRSINYITWNDLKKDFGVTITRNYKEAIRFFTRDVDLRRKFPLDRQWICATNFYVNDVNEHFHQLRLNENNENDLGSFYSSTTISEILQSEDISKNLDRSQAFDYLNVMKFKDMPNYKIDLAKGEPMCLMRNINTAKGMAKNKRCYVISRTENTVIVQFEDKSTATIPRINFPGETNGIVFTRHQIPLKPIFAGTIHKSQGLTLNNVVVDMRSRFWEHGQLYVALSRVRDPRNLCILLPEKEEENDSLISPISDETIVNLVNQIEDQPVDLEYIQNWEIINNEPIESNTECVSIENSTQAIGDETNNDNDENDVQKSIDKEMINNDTPIENSCTNDNQQIETNENGDKNITTAIPFRFSGLVNLGCTCYLNSIIQVLFNLYQFRKNILTIEITDNNILKNLQDTFSLMLSFDTNYSSNSIAPIDLINALGLQKQLNINFDAHEILLKIFAELPEYYSDLPLLSFFEIQLRSVTFLSDSKSIHSENSEIFLCLDVEQTKGSSINEQIQNIGKDIQISELLSKRLLFINTPPVLIFYIKRYHYNTRSNSYIKNIVKFNIDNIISIYNYSEKVIYNYTLFAVINHSGRSVKKGHYFSTIRFIKNGSYKYYKFNDQIIDEIDEETFFNLAIGDKNTCAVLTFYIRNDRINEFALI